MLSKMISQTHFLNTDGLPYACLLGCIYIIDNSLDTDWIGQSYSKLMLEQGGILSCIFKYTYMYTHTNIFCHEKISELQTLMKNYYKCNNYFWTVSGPILPKFHYSEVTVTGNHNYC
jgi:hypothetical protein